ncbi:6-phosphofructokinase, partial [Lachnotalea glycerini]
HRGGSSCPSARVLSTRLVTSASQLFFATAFGTMVSIVHGDISKVPLDQVAGKLKMVIPESSIIKVAKLGGTSFGD